MGSITVTAEALSSIRSLYDVKRRGTELQIAQIEQIMSFLPRKRRPKGTGPRATKNTGKTLYRCDQCEYETSWPSWLRTHKRVHTGERPFKCHLCSYSSSQSSNLQQHLKRHSDERPFKCNLCEYSCKRGHQLNTHRRTHIPRDILLNMPASSPMNNLDYALGLDSGFPGVSVPEYPVVPSSGGPLALAAAAAVASSNASIQNSTMETFMEHWKGLNDMELRNSAANEENFQVRTKSDDESSDDGTGSSPGRLQIDEPSIS
ncbi:oocyte zinc finger protein XlCOF28-like [Galendromus occidentalis]|uniref:Oocyte zinc finger protein XlCOF28-like n=1 Tax=Galendromus occidentalis TaxID=34638 RepID=A0AAJ7SHK9_9ACAR|nr:oocyte zinc finger protein XlCOF28-like [Galendromus occidentalis]